LSRTKKADKLLVLHELCSLLVEECEKQLSTVLEMK
jgi:hypothetical protein